MIKEILQINKCEFKEMYQSAFRKPMTDEMKRSDSGEKQTD